MTLVGARIAKNQAPRKPATGHRQSATSTATARPVTTSAYKTTAAERLPQNVP
jgi:hypothetical protein